MPPEPHDQYQIAIKILKESSEGHKLLTATAQAEKALTNLATKAQASGFGLVINTHSGVIDYHNPKYPPFGPKLRLRLLANTDD